jgi:hypothetical protein
MAKTSTKNANKNVTVESEPKKADVPVVAPVEGDVPVVQKKAKKAKKDVPVVDVPASVVVADISVPVPVPESGDASAITAVADVAIPTSVLADNSIVILLGELASLDQQEASIQQQRRIKRRLLEKAIVKVLKANNKATSKKQKRSGNRQPSGFIRPTLISDELALFLGKDVGTELARTAVTNQINTYIKSNNLKDATNGRQINADDKLAALLKLGKDDVLTYFNLQKYMKHHFIKKVVAPTNVAV